MAEDGPHRFLGGVVVDHRHVESGLLQEIEGRDERIAATLLAYLGERLADDPGLRHRCVNDHDVRGPARAIRVVPVGQPFLDVAGHRLALPGIVQAPERVGWTSRVRPGGSSEDSTVLPAP